MPLKSVRKCPTILCFFHTVCRGRHVKWSEEVFIDVGLECLVEEQFREVRERFIHEVVVLERLAELSRGLEVSHC